MRRHLPRFFVLAFAALLLVVGTAARSAEIDMSGTWTGTYGTDDPNVMAKVIITIKEASGKYSGSISLPDEKLMIGIRTSAMDDGFFAVSGVLTSKDPNGNPVQAHVTFGGFVDDDGTAWDGTWSVGDKDGRIAVSNLFSVTREAKVAQPKPVTGGPQPGKKTTIGTIAPKPDTSKPATQTPTGTDQSVISGTWTGTFRASNQTAGTMTIKMSQNRGGYSGTGEVVDDDGTTIPPITFSDGKQSGKKFTLSGSMMALGEDGEEIPASVTLSGDLSGDSWRGTLTVAPDADDTAGLTATFRLTRAPLWNVDSTPKQEKQGGGISGRGKQGGAN